MADTGTTRDRVWGSVTNERDEAFMATVALFPHGQIWFYAHDIASWCAEAVYTCTASLMDPPTWTPTDQQQLKDASSLKKSTDAGKKPTYPPEIPPPRTR